MTFEHHDWLASAFVTNRAAGTTTSERYFHVFPQKAAAAAAIISLCSRFHARSQRSFVCAWLLCFCVWLYDSEHVAGRICCIGKPANVRNRHLRHAGFTAALLNFLYRLVERRDANRVQRTGTLAFAGTRESAVDPWLLVIAGRNQPVFDRAAFELLELPAENVLIKRTDSVRTIGVNFKVSYAIHSPILVLFVVS